MDGEAFHCGRAGGFGEVIRLLACDPTETNKLLAARVWAEFLKGGRHDPFDCGADPELEILGLLRYTDKARRNPIYGPEGRHFELFPLKMEGGGPHGLWYWRRGKPGPTPRCEAGRDGYRKCISRSTHTVYTPPEFVGRSKANDPPGFDPPPWTWSVCSKHAPWVLRDRPEAVVVVGDWVVELKRDPETGVQLRGDGR